MNWPTPPGEIQYSNLTDTWGCVSFAMVHCIESQEIAQTGQTKGYSERALAKMSGTVYTGQLSHRGNTVDRVFQTVKEYGLIPEALWPTDIVNYTADEFYKDIPPEILSQAVKLNVDKIDGGQNLSLSPLLVQLKNGLSHLVEGLNTAQYFDTYKQFVKNYTSDDDIVWTGNLILNPKGKRMLVFFQVTGMLTVWTLMDGQWVGFADPTALNNYIGGRPYSVIQVVETEFNKLKANPDVFKS